MADKIKESIAWADIYKSLEAIRKSIRGLQTRVKRLEHKVGVNIRD